MLAFALYNKVFHRVKITDFFIPPVCCQQA